MLDYKLLRNVDFVKNLENRTSNTEAMPIFFFDRNDPLMYTCLTFASRPSHPKGLLCMAHASLVSLTLDKSSMTKHCSQRFFAQYV